jgi:hypothetical protein
MSIMFDLQVLRLSHGMTTKISLIHVAICSGPACWWALNRRIFALPGSPHQPGPRGRPGLRSRMIWVTTTWVAVPKENNA